MLPEYRFFSAQNVHEYAVRIFGTTCMIPLVNNGALCELVIGGHRSRQTTSQVIYGRAIEMPVFALCNQSLCVSLKCSAGQHFSKQTNELFPLFPDSSIYYRQKSLIVVLNDEVG